MEKLFVESKKIYDERQKYFAELKVNKINKQYDRFVIFTTQTKPIPYDDLLLKTVNYPDEYHIIINKLKSHEINVIHMIEYTDNKSNNWSDKVFDFYCTKGDWYFIVYYLLDGDIPEGILGVANVYHRDGNVIKQYCDLYCHNTEKKKADKFIQLINSNNVEDYFANIHQKLKILYQKLKNYYGPDLVSTDLYLPTKSLNNQFVHAPFVKVNNIYIQEIDQVYEHELDYFRFSTCVKDEYKHVYYYYYGEHDHHKFLCKAYKIKMDTEFTEICKLIDSCNLENTGDYGFAENDELYNHEDLKLWIDDFYKQTKKINKQLSNYDEGSLEITTEPMSVYAGKIINLKCRIRFGEYMSPGDGDICPISKYEYEEYLIAFKYNKTKDPDNCYLKIYSELIDPETNIGYDIVEPIVMHGSFTQMFAKMIKFITTLYEKHGFIIPESV